ncbi:hypothetical protein HDV00_010265 [Rhizophlyctis rosea]|nr:hypothetical protein HDV00_010265 [Rhizophlyctis rosea]
MTDKNSTTSRPAPTAKATAPAATIQPKTTTSSTLVSTIKPVTTSAPPTNKLSNDGHFLAGLTVAQEEEEAKKKKQEELAKRKAWEASFKRRGKRKNPATQETQNKKSKPEEEIAADLDPAASAYLKEMRKMKEKLGEGDSGSGVRPLVK